MHSQLMDKKEWRGQFCVWQPRRSHLEPSTPLTPNTDVGVKIVYSIGGGEISNKPWCKHRDKDNSVALHSHVTEKDEEYKEVIEHPLFPLLIQN